MHAIFIRAPWVEQVGAGPSRCSAASAAGEAAGRIVAVRQGPLMATSFHPEVGGDVRIHRYFVDPIVHAVRKEQLMSGHSKWATTKHKKAVIDARRGKMFAKLIKNIEVAARMGGGDLGRATRRCTTPIQKAKKSSVPNDNIDRAVKRGSGAEAGGADYTTIMYEGYGPNGVAFLIECLTDNKNRAAMEVRTAMNRNGGSLADPGSVSYMFQRKGVVIVPQEQDGKQVSEDDVLEATLDAGAEDVNDLGEAFEVVSEATDLVAVRTALQAAGVDYDSADASFVPVDAGRARQGRRRQGAPSRRGARGPRRRAERLRQLRRLRRGHGSRSTRDGAPVPVRLVDGPAPTGASHPTAHPPAASVVRTGVRTSEGSRNARAGDRPGADPVRRRRGRR